MDDGFLVTEITPTQRLDEPVDPAVGQVVASPVAVEDQIAQQLGVRRSPGTEPGLQPTAGQHVNGREVLREPERALVADRDHRGAELDPRGALGRRGEEGRGRRHTVLQVPLTDPGAVEAEPLPELEQLQGRLETGVRVVVLVVPRGQERQRRKPARPLRSGFRVHGIVPARDATRCGHAVLLPVGGGGGSLTSAGDGCWSTVGTVDNSRQSR
ncbi:hypothetical protein ACG83_29005 [Frankia sp. R43]|nr:hypothetical protein ACG83_29005 [Frankia sp. R43]